MTNSPLSPEVLVPRVGEHLVEKGLITPDDLKRALEYQQNLREKNEDRLLGQVLIDLGIIDRPTLDSAVTEQILQLRVALQEANQQLVEANQQLERRVQERTIELQRALEKLAELNQLKANIVANISHELRTPLTHLKGYLELMLSGDLGGMNDQQTGALQIMERSSERLGRLIEDLILFSVSERDKMHLHIEAFSPRTLCESLYNRVASKAAEKKIKMVLECEPRLPDVDGDVEKISWVVMQFLDNAFKFTPAGGTVTLRASRNDRLVNISVLDNGIGIPTSRMGEIFESFTQLDGSTTRRVGGTGLGLALAKKIIETHGSIIQVTSDVGKGSCFGFSLKIHGEKTPAVQPFTTEPD